MSCVALFGGSFNPPHVGHVLAVVYVRSIYRLDGVLVVPVFDHPFQKELAPFDERLHMTRLALDGISGVEVSDVERRLGGESRTLYTIEALLAERPERALRLVVGADVLHDRDKWYRWDRIAELAPPIVIGRAGVAHPEAPPPYLPEVSSTELRAALRQGRARDIEGLVPLSVREHIAARGLYRGSP